MDRWSKSLWAIVLTVAVTLGSLGFGSLPANAGLTDDHYDGNIFALYAGNGSLVPPRVTLADALKRGRPTLLFFYTEDSSDCKQYAPVVSQIQQFYGRVADLIPINVDAVPFRSSYPTTEPGFYYKGLVPQTILFNQQGKIVLDAQGQIPFEQVDDVLRQVFDLLPRSESVELRRRIVNEINTELVPE
ncbi:MAG: thylakoid membrane photosystem I accumulation factor [Leptolyngbyaceae cyanobacterium bins.59]|nr:thylakoid membrane photosystem I accumulation factor [Leptolyngbyaceae cyanobacterium bins.59]